MIDIPELRRLYRVKRFDFWVAAAAFVGRALGRRAGRRRDRHRALARLARLRRHLAGDAAARPRAGNAGVPRRATRIPDDETFPGYAVVRLDGGLFFATAEALEERIRELALDADPPLRAVVLDIEGVDFVDSQGAAKLAEILDFAESAGVELRLARVKPAVASGARERRCPGAPRRGPRPRQRPPRRRGAARSGSRLALRRPAGRGRSGRRSARGAGRGR